MKTIAQSIADKECPYCGSSSKYEKSRMEKFDRVEGQHQEEIDIHKCSSKKCRRIMWGFTSMRRYDTNEKAV